MSIFPDDTWTVGTAEQDGLPLVIRVRSQMPAVAASATEASGQPGTASSMPITAQNTISCTTRGFVNAQY